MTNRFDAMIGLIGRKLGMCHVFDADGREIPVTVVEAGPCTVTQRKTRAKDGYDAVQLGFGEIREEKATKPVAGEIFKACKGCHDNYRIEDE